MTMGDLCAECRNYFLGTVIQGQFTIDRGVLRPVPTVPDGAYIRIVGSVFNDGVWQVPAAGLTDETFSGAVWLMHVPPDFVTLLNDINAWEAANSEAVRNATAEVLSGPYTSESYGGYTYTKKTGFGDVATNWRDPRLGFAARLNVWRKINGAAV